jgi:hypothetical protein
MEFVCNNSVPTAGIGEQVEIFITGYEMRLVYSLSRLLPGRRQKPY